VIGPEHLQLDAAALGAVRSVVSEPTPHDASLVAVRGKTLREAIEETKRVMVRRAVEENGGNWAAAARSLGMARSNLHHMAERLGLRR
jgi:anaerobic nitric oxide reductase transcription regulator